jgi:hypothetical protein
LPREQDDLARWREETCKVEVGVRGCLGDVVDMDEVQRE